ncbi:MAG: hypothetical protein ACREKS_02290 [Candidatus Rokuibacteriota bacterium]
MVTGEGRGLRPVGHFDCAGGGQVVVEGEVAFIAHMHAPAGTTLVDVSDPIYLIDRGRGLHILERVR